MGTKLTKRVIDRLLYQGQDNERCIVWDTVLPAFGVRVYPSGRKAFVLFYRAGGRQRLFSLGSYGVLTLEQARTQARQRLGEVIGGEDPMEKREKTGRAETLNGP